MTSDPVSVVGGKFYRGLILGVFYHDDEVMINQKALSSNAYEMHVFPFWLHEIDLTRPDGWR